MLHRIALDLSARRSADTAATPLPRWPIDMPSPILSSQAPITARPQTSRQVRRAFDRRRPRVPSAKELKRFAEQDRRERLAAEREKRRRSRDKRRREGEHRRIREREEERRMVRRLGVERVVGVPEGQMRIAGFLRAGNGGLRRSDGEERSEGGRLETESPLGPVPAGACHPTAALRDLTEVKETPCSRPEGEWADFFPSNSQVARELEGPDRARLRLAEEDLLAGLSTQDLTDWSVGDCHGAKTPPSRCDGPDVAV